MLDETYFASRSVEFSTVPCPSSNTQMYWFMQQFNVSHNRVFTIFTIHVKICKSDKVDGKLDGGEDPT